jgi:hypothetical protein
MLPDAPDAHAYQLPDAPPPPKPPPPPLNPPLPLELLLPEYEPPPPDDDAMLSPNMVKMKAMTPTMTDAASDPAMNHANTPTTLPVVTEPISLPKVVRRIAPTTKIAKRTKGLNGSKLCDEPELCRGAGAAAKFRLVA